MVLNSGINLKHSFSVSLSLVIKLSRYQAPWNLTQRFEKICPFRSVIFQVYLLLTSQMTRNVSTFFTRMILTTIPSMRNLRKTGSIDRGALHSKLRKLVTDGSIEDEEDLESVEPSGWSDDEEEEAEDDFDDLPNI